MPKRTGAINTCCHLRRDLLKLKKPETASYRLRSEQSAVSGLFRFMYYVLLVRHGCPLVG